jgi:hypothetical protein
MPHHGPAINIHLSSHSTAPAVPVSEKAASHRNFIRGFGRNIPKAFLHDLKWFRASHLCRRGHRAVRRLRQGLVSRRGRTPSAGSWLRRAHRGACLDSTIRNPYSLVIQVQNQPCFVGDTIFWVAAWKTDQNAQPTPAGIGIFI